MAKLWRMRKIVSQVLKSVLDEGCGGKTLTQQSYFFMHEVNINKTQLT